MGRGRVHWHHCCGLYWLRPKCVHHYVWYNLVPLISSNVECTLIDQMTQVDITQEFINNEGVTIEASYMFPLDERAAVCGFEAEIAGKVIVGKAKEKQQAKREYDQAVARGDGAYLLEEKKADIFKMKVGNLLPGERVKIKITYVAEMKSELTDLKKRFLLPTTVAPRYTPPHDWREGDSDRNFEPMSGSSKGYQMSINMSCHMMSDIKSIESPSHSITHQINGKTASVGLSLGSQLMEKDFIVNVEVSLPHEPRVCLELNENGDLAAMVTLFPHFQFRDIPAELVFVVDRSGSMGGSRIKEAREVMQLFMRSLPQDCYFNVVGFGSRHTNLYSSSRKYTDETLREATNHISGMDANLGGTELVAPLTSVFNSPPIRGYPRQVFLITDGQVSNTERVIQLVEAHHRTNRVFTLGLGKDVSHHLVEGIARAGQGTAQFVTSPSDMAAKVMKQLKEAIQPALKNVKVDWGGKVEGSSAASTPAPAAPQGAIVMSLLGYVSPEASAPPAPRVEVHQAPFRVPPVFDSQHFLIYAMYSENKPPATVKITAESPDGPLTVELPVDPAKAIRGKLIHTLAARAMIRDLEEGRSWMTQLGYDVKSARVKDEIVRLGTKYQLASLHTSFIAVEERNRQPTGIHYECWFDHYDPYIVHPTPVPVVHNVVHHHHHAAPARQCRLSSASSSSSYGDARESYRSGGGGRGGGMGGASYGAPERARKKDKKKGSSNSFAPSASYAPQSKSYFMAEAGSYAAPPPPAPGSAPPPPSPSAGPGYAQPNMMSGFGGPPPHQQQQQQQQQRQPQQPQLTPKPSVTTIAMEQSISGSFPLNDAVIRIVSSLDRSTLLSIYSNFNISKQITGAEGEKIIATAVVIAYVEKNYANEKDVWERFIGKARLYLEQQLSGKGAESANDVINGVAVML